MSGLNGVGSKGCFVLSWGDLQAISAVVKEAVPPNPDAKQYREAVDLYMRSTKLSDTILIGSGLSNYCSVNGLNPNTATLWDVHAKICESLGQ